MRRPGTDTLIKMFGAVVILIAAASTSAKATGLSAYDRHVEAAKKSMMAVPDQALTHARRAHAAAAAMSGARERLLAQAQAQGLEAEALNRVNKPEQARVMIERTLADVQRLAPNSKLHGEILSTTASVNWMLGNVQQALGQFQQAYEIYGKVNEPRSQAKTLQYIGTIYFDARDYPRMLKYYTQSAEVFQGDPALTVAAFNNQGDALKEMRRYAEAIASYGKALRVARRINSSVLEVRILTNLASAHMQRGDHVRADSFAAAGLSRAAGQNTGWEPFLWGVKAQVAFARKDNEAATRYLSRTFQITDLTKTTMQFREFHETGYRLFQAKGDYQASLVHLTAFKRLDDESRDVAVSTNSALLGARFDFANQALNIAKLKAQRLQSDVALERSRSRLNSMALYGLVGALVVAAVVLVGTMLALFSIRRSRNAVSSANDTLSNVNAKLEKALTAKTRFLATTSHEIRTPLNGILGMTEIMLHDDALIGTQRERVRIVHDAGETMKALVDDILDVAKIETGKLSIEQAAVQLKPLLEGVASLWASQAEAKGLTLTVELEACPVAMIGDARRLRQIVFNLMSNAIKFTDRGSVALVAAAHGDELRMSVTDTGIGIEQEEIEAVFDSFHQVDGDLTRQFGGTGLGLAICRDLARAMGGSVELVSAIGVGSTFTVRLPLALPCVVALRTASTAWPRVMSDAALLLVENNPLRRSIITAAVSENVASIVAVSSDDIGDAAARQVHHVILDADVFDDDLILRDFVVDMASPPNCTIVTLLCSAPLTADRYALLARSGVTLFLQRPLTVDDLLNALASANEVRTVERHKQDVALDTAVAA